MDIDGYIADTAFPPHFPWHFVPSWIDHALRTNSIAPPRQARDAYRYLDLGCGPGVHLVAMAACAPEAEFVGVDANPDAPTTARELAATLGLSNVTFRTETFEDTARWIRPEFDYIAALGILSWISPVNRACVMKILGAGLVPGGAAATGYNSLPGRAGEFLIQSLVLDAAKRSTDVQSAAISTVLGRLADLAKTGARGLQGERVRALLRHHGGQDPDFLPHEYLSEHWTPLASSDIVKSARSEGLEFVGSLTEKEIVKDFLLSKAQRALLTDIDDDIDRERLIDLCLDQHFRRDLLVKPRSSEITMNRLDGYFVAAYAPEHVSLQTVMPAGILRFDNPVAHAVLAALQEGPQRLGDIVHPGTPADCENTVNALVAAGIIRPCDPPLPCAPIAMNAWILSEITNGRPTIRTFLTDFGPVKLPKDVLETLASGSALSADDTRRYGL